jgi:hypothetical protein
MSAAPQYKTPPSDGDGPMARTADAHPTPGNDSAEAKVVEALVRSRERTWHTFARSLLLGGLLAGLVTAAVVVHIY